ncbi:FMN-dependent NADH-azoreductase [Actinocorallia longicatena]|uniref:FMN dependent NADH:quinone oxidoreductase n=1 Tax=Actinocorallia longicatena TaxID=111803 RepID=A0ABP6QHQ3_9ACTN
MPHLLHLDASPRPDGVSISRTMSAAYARQWRDLHPDGTYAYRNLSLDPIPPVDALYADMVHTVFDPETADPVRLATLRAAETVIAEVEAADVVVIGCPMHNLTVPSVLKAWIDRLLMARTIGRRIAPRPIVVLTARGGGYSPGTPMAALDFQEPYLRGVLGLIGLDAELSFIHTELTMAGTDPALAAYAEAAAASRAAAELAVAEHVAATAPRSAPAVT